jgi:hypothetical protein
MFSDWALPYWVAAKPIIDADRTADRTNWQEFESLWDALLTVEAQKRRRPRTDVTPTPQQVNALLDA